MEEGSIIICQITGGVPVFNGTFAIMTNTPDETIEDMKEFYGGNVEILKRTDMESECERRFIRMTDTLSLYTKVSGRMDSPIDLIYEREKNRIRNSNLSPLEKISLYEKLGAKKINYRHEHFRINRVKT